MIFLDRIQLIELVQLDLLHNRPKRIPTAAAQAALLDIYLPAKLPLLWLSISIVSKSVRFLLNWTID